MSDDICWLCDMPIEEDQARHGGLRVHWTCAQNVPKDIRDIIELDGLKKAMEAVDFFEDRGMPNE